MRTLQLYAFIYFCFGIIASAKKLTYKSYELFDIDTTNLNSSHELKSLLDHYNLYDVWKSPTHYDQRYLVLTKSRGSKRLKKTLRRLKLAHKTRRDIAEMIAENKKSNRRRKVRHSRKFRFDEYHKYLKIFRWMKKFSHDNRDIVTMVQVGTTNAGRSIWGLQIGIKTSDRQKPVFWQDSLIHAREWIAGATLLWLTNKLVDDYRKKDAVIVQVLDKLDFMMVPVWNVDGYIFSWNRNRFWRKSRRVLDHKVCKGVDLNRNFFTPYLEKDPRSQVHCSPVYRGAEPFSEPETRTVAAYLKNLDLAAYITIHSFYQLWMYPFGFTDDPCQDQEELDELSGKAVRAMKSVHNESYEHGSIKDVAYLVAGGSIDWTYLNLCVKYSFGIELRDRGTYGFLLPSIYIIPTAEEYYAGFKVIARHVSTTTNSLQRSGCSRFSNVTDA